MENAFTITWQNQLVNVSRRGGEKYYALVFRDGEERLLEHTVHGWRYIHPAAPNQDEIENELLDEESSLQLGLEVEAGEIGKLIDEKEKG